MTSCVERHLARRFPIYLWLIVIWIAFGRYFGLSINLSDSLPGTLYLIQKGINPVAGEYGAFIHVGEKHYKLGTHFLKRVAGVGGAVVRTLPDVSGGTVFFVDDEFVGRAKPFALSGEPLAPGPSGQIPQGFYYMTSPHPDSFDSRYQAVGWIGQEQILGRAIRLL